MGAEMSMETIRRTRGVPCKRGGRVKYTGSGKVQLGTIRSTHQGYLMIQLDGDKWPKTFHPTWKLEYLDAE